MKLNKFNQAVGDDLINYQKADLPDHTVLSGTYCRLEPITENHFEGLFTVFGPHTREENWTYLPFNRAENADQFRVLFNKMIQSNDPFHYAIIDSNTSAVLGTLALMRMNPESSSAEVGYVIYSDSLKQTRIATEAQFLMALYAFDVLGYRRYEWKCDALNEPSRRAALRLGFTYEGTFRNATVYKGRNRDTAWFAMIDSEWEARKDAFIAWLSPANFSESGVQINALESFRTKGSIL